MGASQIDLIFDTEVIDSALFQRINGSVASTMWLLTGTVIMVSVSPYIFLILIPTVVLYLKLHQFYRTSWCGAAATGFIDPQSNTSGFL